MVRRHRFHAVAFALFVLTATPASAREFFVAPAGRPDAHGTITDPWNIETALAQPVAVGPGDVIWLRGGTYPLRRTLISRLTGRQDGPIIVRQFPGERATLDCRLVIETAAGTDCLLIQGGHTWYWGFEITNSTLVRRVSRAGSTADPRGLAIQGQGGVGTKLINLVIHDVGTTLFESQPSGIEIYGLIAYNSGWEGPDRSHGPGLYVRNRSSSPRKEIRESIIFQHYRQGLQGYGTFANVFSNFLLEGNVFFNNGIGADGFHRNLMFGNENTGHSGNVFRENFTYFAPGSGAGSNTLGSLSGGCQGLVLLGNVFAHGPSRAAVEVNNCVGVEAAGNLFFGKTSYRPPESARGLPGSEFRSAFPQNVYFGDGLGTPRGVAAFVRANHYEPGRAHVIVYNWDLRPSVSVDLSSLAIRPGDHYEIRSVQDLYGVSIRGIYRGGSLEAPMKGWRAELPVGHATASLPPTFPEFGVFVLTWTGSATSVNRPPRMRRTNSSGGLH